jgi:hypothetical protein
MNGVVNFLMGLVKTGSQSVVSDPRDHLTSPNGFLREAAVKALSNQPQLGTLPALLERLNDWVPQVRSAAQEAVRGQMQTAFLPDWIASLEALVRLGHARRVDHTSMLREVALFLQRSEHLPAVLVAAKASSLHVRRFVFDMQWMNAAEDAARFHLLEGAIGGDDVVVASRALLRLESLASPIQRRRLYGAACSSPFASVRYEGVRWMVENPDDATDSLVCALGLDPSANVRWWCLRWLRAIDGVQTVVDLAEGVASDDVQPIRARRVALQWLMDVDPEKALSATEAWLGSESPRLRRDALSVRLSKGDRDERVRWMRQAFDDPSPSIQRLLLDKAHRGVWAPTVSQVLERLRLEPTPEAVLRVISHQRLYSAWDWLQCLLEMWPLGVDLGVERSLRDALKSWPRQIGNGGYGPSENQKARIAELWSTCRGQVDRELQHIIGFHLGTFGIVQ